MKHTRKQSRYLISIVLSLCLVCGTLSACATRIEEQPTHESSGVNAEQHIDSIATDYTNANNWLSKPEILHHEADVLYFYPTCYNPSSADDPRVCSINNESMRAGAQAKLLDQAGAFSENADLYAPYYRQVDAASLAGLTQEEMLAIEGAEPKTDVFAALDYYFEHCNEGRPFIMAGHSQGAMMVQLILDEYMQDHPEYYGLMVAAYMLGNAPTTSWLEQNPHVNMAQGEHDLGVVVSWNTEGPGNSGHYNMVAPEGSVCINPLNWKTDDTPASVDENQGSLVLGSNGEYEIVDGLADATIDLERGTLICTSVDPAEYAMPLSAEALFGPESYHSWDIKFYYENIRENVATRLAAYWNSIEIP